jgi:hypothetical protein
VTTDEIDRVVHEATVAAGIWMLMISVFILLAMPESYSQFINSCE